MTSDELQRWRDSEMTVFLREKYRKQMDAFKNEVVELATRQGPLDAAIHAKAGAIKRLEAVIRDLTEGESL